VPPQQRLAGARSGLAWRSAVRGAELQGGSAAPGACGADALPGLRVGLARLAPELPQRRAPAGVERALAGSLPFLLEGPRAVGAVGYLSSEGLEQGHREAIPDETGAGVVLKSR